jgi:hypothetical protein
MRPRPGDEPACDALPGALYYEHADTQTARAARPVAVIELLNDFDFPQTYI